MYSKKFAALSLLLMLMVMSEVGATKYSRESIELNNDPSLAKTIAIGTFIEESGKEFFVSERGWTLYPPKIFIPRLFAGERVKAGKTGEKQLFYSVKETNMKGELMPGAEGMIPLKSTKAKEIIEKLAVRKKIIGEINPSWQFCESDSECIQSKNKCDKLIGVNKKYQKYYLNFIKTEKTKAECSKSASIRAEKTIESKCIENFCS